MTKLADKLYWHYFGSWEHPYRTFKGEVRKYLKPDATLLDAGCGRSAPILKELSGEAQKLIGIDVVEATPDVGVEYHCRDLDNTGLTSESVDVVMARSVVEHIEKPNAVFSEMYRVLKPGGRFVFLTANFWDYASLIAAVVPNRFHPWIVAKTEGREEHDTFPVQYKANTQGSINRLARDLHFEVETFRYLGQHPSYLEFSTPLYLLGSWYELAIASFESTHWLRGWILCTLRKPSKEALRFLKKSPLEADQAPTRRLSWGEQEL